MMDLFEGLDLARRGVIRRTQFSGLILAAAAGAQDSFTAPQGTLGESQKDHLLEGNPIPGFRKTSQPAEVRAVRTMTCRQLGGVCEEEFRGENFEEIAEMNKRHGMQMLQKGGEDHLKAIDDMKELIKAPFAMKEWFENRKKEFGAWPEDWPV